MMFILVTCSQFRRRCSFLMTIIRDWKEKNLMDSINSVLFEYSDYIGVLSYKIYIGAMLFFKMSFESRHTEQHVDYVA